MFVRAAIRKSRRRLRFLRCFSVSLTDSTWAACWACNCIVDSADSLSAIAFAAAASAASTLMAASARAA
eukprot:3084843-Prymnesium_polylepis.1